MASKEDEEYLKPSLKEALENVVKCGGHQFDAVIVKSGKIVATSSNKVIVDKDPTAHAEVVANRNACAKLDSHDLTDCDLYSSFEPCPICYSAADWADIKKIYYAADSKYAVDFSFREERQRTIPMAEVKLDNKYEPFEAWNTKFVQLVFIIYLEHA